MIRRLALAAVLLAGTPAAAGAQQSPKVQRGEQLYGQSCIRCHGANGAGIVQPATIRSALGEAGLGPPLKDAGALAADFYLRTGYMPLVSPFDVPKRKTPRFPQKDIDALVAYVASLGHGPPVPKPHPERGRLSAGLKLFTEHCAGCHQVVAEGGVVTDTRVPPLEDATPTQIAEAVRIGPYLMPRFSQKDISDAQLDSIIRYVQYAKNPDDRGGWALGHLGPFPEGMVTWLLAGSLLVALSLAIGKRVSS
jgi:ubiquinol-cytochrome c reductase cytochrome c subunit